MSYLMILTILMVSCSNDSTDFDDDDMNLSEIQYTELPVRPGPRIETTQGVPHVQIGVELVHDVHEEMVRRIYSIPGLEDRRSVIGSWRGMWLSDSLTIVAKDAVIDGREYAHIHHDGSLHIFLEPERAVEAVEAKWAIHHPFALQNQEGWDGFVMLYTPQSFEELAVTMQLIVDGYNYVTGQNLKIDR